VATIIKKIENDALVMEVTIPLGTTMLDGERSIEQALNEGVLPAAVRG
jgi:hypothetical protein